MHINCGVVGIIDYNIIKGVSMKNRIVMTVSIIAISAILAACSAVPPKGSLETGFTVWGYVGYSTTEPASGVMVLLIDGATDKPIASKKSNFFGKYTFSALQPGYYKVKASDKTLELVVTDQNQRLDIDLSAADGTMNYAAGAMKNMTAPGKPGGDAQLAQKFTGKWYSFSGATSISGGGGSESQMAFCPDGSYYDSYESGYYGGSFGSASQSGASGSWSVSGTVQQGQISITYSNGSTSVLEYQQADDPQCYYIDGRMYCYNGACD